MVLQPNPPDHQREIRAVVPETHGIYAGENHREDENTGYVPQHHTVVRGPARCAHLRVHREAMETPDQGTEGETWRVR